MSKLELSPEILDALQELSSLIPSDDAVEKTLKTVVDLMVSTLSGCDSAGVTVRPNGNYATAAASDDFTLKIDGIQYDTGEGPCLTALESGERQLIEGVSLESRWPDFCARAADHGFRSGASFPLRVNEMPGALNLYSKTEQAFDEEMLQTCGIFAKQAAIALENAQLYSAARRLGEQLNEALQTRDVIGRAKGILMEREGITDEEAFEMLRTISQNQNVKLRDVAERLITKSSR